MGPNDARVTRPSNARGMLRSLSVALALLFVLPACQSGEKADPAGQVSDGFPAASQEMVYASAVNAVRRQGFSIDPSESSPQTGVVKSVWNTNLGVFGNTGRRDRVTVRVTPVPDRPSYFRVETNVIRETNTNTRETQDPLMAEWDNPQRLTVMENLITRTIEMDFLQGDVSSKYRQRYDLPESTNPRLRTLPPEPEPQDEGLLPGVSWPGG